MKLVLPVLARTLMPALLGALLAVSQPAQAVSGPPSTNMTWLPAAVDADIEAAFSKARGEGKPLLLYWGASWCPPCNQLKATLFNRQEFAAQARSFVAVHIDGDLPGAQRLGTRFKVRGYPTLVLMTPDGQEITRLPGEVDTPQVMAALQAGLAGARPVKSVLGDARAGRALNASEWRLLAFYSWETDEAQLVPAAQRPELLVDLALRAGRAGADEATSTRLWLKALAASDGGKGLRPEAAQHALVDRVLADPAQARLHMDVLTNEARDIVRVLQEEPGAGRTALLQRYDAALRRLQGDSTLSRADRVGALISRVQLARIDVPADAVKVSLPAALLAEVRETARRMDAEIRDGYERMAVITAVAYLQGQAGLWDESNALLQANLAKTHSPYYLMSQLGGNARKLGRKDDALRWYEQAWDKSVGPATRLQWGSNYLSALVDLAPADATRIEAAAARLIDEAGADSGAFYERSGRSLQNMGRKLQSWNTDGRHAAVLRRLEARLGKLCGREDAGQAQRAQCAAVFRPSAASAPASSVAAG